MFEVFTLAKSKDFFYLLAKEGGRIGIHKETKSKNDGSIRAVVER